VRHFLKVHTGLNIMPLLLQVYSNAHLWAEDRIRSTYSADSPHQEVDDILIRWSDGDNIGDQLQCDWTPAGAQLPYAKDLAFLFMSAFRGEQLGRVMITRLAPGKRITPHKDVLGQYAAFYTRLHVPLQSDPGVVFLCADEQVQMQPGEAWWFNGHEVHSVINNSSRDRLNLIIDMKT
jgi:aspartyl/asparaginyl beta-hydroxylase